MWFICVELEQETSAPPPKKILDPPLPREWNSTLRCYITSLSYPEKFTDHVALNSQVYVELTGDEDQPSSVPDKVHLQVRHLSASYFRAGDGTTKKYYQSIGSYRNVEFDRFSVTNKRKCQEAKAQGGK